MPPTTTITITTITTIIIIIIMAGGDQVVVAAINVTGRMPTGLHQTGGNTRAAERPWGVGAEFLILRKIGVPRQDRYTLQWPFSSAERLVVIPSPFAGAFGNADRTRTCNHPYS